MSVLHLVVIVCSVIMGIVSISHSETECETKERTEQHAKERYDEQVSDTK